MLFGQVVLEGEAGRLSLGHDCYCEWKEGKDHFDGRSKRP